MINEFKGKPPEGGELTALPKSGPLARWRRTLCQDEIGDSAPDSTAVKFLAAVREGENNLNRGEGIPQEQVEKRFAAWVKKWRSK
jgi:hypothetical protein